MASAPEGNQEATRTVVISGSERNSSVWFVFPVYLCVWIATRFPAIAANTLFFDDFALPNDPESFYNGSYRPLLTLEYRVMEFVHAGHFWTRMPKYSAAVYLAAAGTVLAALLVKWAVARRIAVAVPLIALANPVLNDAGLWQSIHAICLALLLILGGLLLWERPGLAAYFAGSFLILSGALGYQIFISLALFVICAEPLIKSLTGKPWVLRATLQKALAVATVSILQIMFMEWLRGHRLQSDARGLGSMHIDSAYLVTKWHSLTDLAVNGVMPVIAWYSDAHRAQSAWMWVPILAAIATFIFVTAFARPRRPFLALGAALLSPAAFVVPGLPTLIMNFNPYAWRVSSPVAFCLAISLVPLLLFLPKALQWSLPIALALLMLPVAHDEARLRAQSYERESRLFAEERSFWSRAQIDLNRVTIVCVPQTEQDDRDVIGSHDLTWGYEVRTPAAWSSFVSPWTARYRTIAAGFRFESCPGPSPLCKRSSACDKGCSDATISYPRIVHDVDARATFICPGIARRRCS